MLRARLTVVGTIKLVATIWSRHVVAAAACLGLLAAPVSAETLVRAGLPLANGPDPYGAAVARLVGSIAEYSRWPDERSALRLCVAGPTDHADRLGSRTLSQRKTITVARVDRPDLTSNCDVVYLGRLSLEDQRQITSGLLGKPVLTIAESDPACRSRAMICLLFEAEALSFRLNIDAVSRSKVRIDARVLRMAAPGGPGK